MYYSIVEKETGRMQGGSSNYHDDVTIPINTSELAHVPLNDELVKFLVSRDPADHIDIMPIDFETTYWNFETASWSISYQTPAVIVDPVQEKIKERQQLLTAAAKKLAIPDISNSARALLEAYVASLNEIEITTETARDCIFSKLPI